MQSAGHTITGACVALRRAPLIATRRRAGSARGFTRPIQRNTLLIDNYNELYIIVTSHCSGLVSYDTVYSVAHITGTSISPRRLFREQRVLILYQ